MFKAAVPPALSSGILIACCVVLLLAGGCASRTVALKPAHPYGARFDEQAYSWHQVRFKWHWSGQDEPRWPLDLLAAHRIMSGLISEYGESIPLWRFHRRAVPDVAGHQFSFIFYSSGPVARDVMASVRDHPLSLRLIEHRLLEKIYLTEPDEAPHLSATSDRSWPEALQSTWPLFIMGVSQTWLALIETEAGTPGRVDDDLEREIHRYEEIDGRIDEIWSEYAQHAFVHHLSAIFGYRPMLIRKRIRF